MNVTANAMGMFFPGKAVGDHVNAHDEIGYVSSLGNNLPVRTRGSGIIASIMNEGLQVFSTTTVCIVTPETMMAAPDA